MKTPEEQDSTWKLLLKSKPQQPSPAFVRNVVREVRKLETPENSLTAIFTWFKRPIVAVPVAIGVTAVMISALTLFQALDLSPEASSTPPPSLAVVDMDVPATTFTDISEDMERIDTLGELVAIADPADLDDAALADLLF
ncbi:MAG: hypothetical protein GXP30_06015 [Verrucomicrobia bacterium]|nr:hypothetical protein [Verrucomicrobiota bacterium]